MKNRIISAVLAAAMILCILPANISSVFAFQNTITISSKEDFIKFSKNCTLDTWSQGKTVNLACDIHFMGSEFSPVPTFGGTFNGNGYTISGVNFTNNGSYAGIFRYVQQNGKITNLNVKAVFVPNGSKSFIGGIAGENYGTVELCSFEGTVKGENVIGGIVGNNADSGQIISCTSVGSIIGENSTGGIAGKNSGFIQSCTNNAAVNTVYEEKKNDISNIDTDTGAIIENYKDNAEENEEESVLGHTDTGGIVGYSSGIVQGCINNANVGYQHIGYNVGGIAGRQSGYMLGCNNFGLIRGRKDVGGIVGQMEPYILLNISEGGLHNIRQELDNLNGKVNRFITDTDNLDTESQKHLTDLSEYSKAAQDNVEILLNQGTDFIDDNLGEINAQSAILSNTLDKLIPVLESLENGGEDCVTALDKAAEALDKIKIYAPDLSEEIDDMNIALSEISKGGRKIKNAVSRAGKASDDLDDAIKFNNQTEVKNAVSELSSSVKDIIVAKQEIKTAIETIETILATESESFENIGINAQEILKNLKTIKENMDITIFSLQVIGNSIDIITHNTEIDFSELKSAAENMEYAIEYLGDAMYYLTDGLEALGVAIKSAYDELDDYADNISGEINTAKDDLSDAITSLSYATDDITTAIGQIKNIITDLSNEKPLEFVKLGDEFKTASEDLFNSLSDISGAIDKLKNTVSNEKDTITNDLTSINNQFNLVMNLMISEFENLQNGTDGVSEIFLDVSDEDIKNTKQGKVAQCNNSGTVEADRNTGGITGAMAIEYAKDPEDDLEKPDSLNFTYRTKAILEGCINDGEIISKKNCTGGIVGLAEIGTVYECQNYADIESTNGNYVGGIAGKCESAIRKSYAKNKLAGKRYIGGIAGKADNVIACYAIVNVKGDENTGAICGDAENKDNLYQNFYVDNGLGAVDGISYSEKAMPVTFDELQNISGIPARFISFTATFIADDKIIETQDVKYGDYTAKIKYPQIPEKDGQFGNWQQIEAEIVTENIVVLCEYKPYITILASEEKNENGKLSLVLAEGEFTDKAKLRITDSIQNPPENADDNTRLYDISLLNTDIEDSDTVTIRLLNENKDKVTAWLLRDGSWEEVKTIDKGKYVMLETKGTQNTVCLQYEERSFNVFWIILSALLVAAIVCIIKFKKPKRRKT